MKRLPLLMLLIVSSITVLCSVQHAWCEPQPPQPQQLWVTMHTAPIDDYCTPCIVSERLLKQSNVEFKKVLEPLGPWPWFKLTDSKGNQVTLKGQLTQSDIDSIKRGEFPSRR